MEKIPPSAKTYLVKSLDMKKGKKIHFPLKNSKKTATGPEKAEKPQDDAA